MMNLKHMEGTWSVEYADGTTLGQWDDTDTERPLRDIDWARAITITFDSEWSHATFDVSNAQPGIQTSIRCRTFMMPFVGIAIRVFMIVLSNTGESVTENSTRAVTYWAPNGAVHTCTDFLCSTVATWSQTISTQGTLGEIPTHS